MNPKIQKTITEIDKTKKKLSRLQAKLRELEQQKTELENAEIVATIRGIKSTPEELSALLNSLQSGDLSAPAPSTAEPERTKAHLTDYAVPKNDDEEDNDNHEVE